VTNYYQTGEKASSNNILLFDFDMELDAINEEMNTNNNMKKKEKDFELPLFSYESVSTATNNFSAVNKLWEGGYGPVYKVRNIFLMNVLWKLSRKPSVVVNIYASLKRLWFSFIGEITQRAGSCSEDAFKKIWTGNWWV
jgi:hypothetical protein